MEGEWQRLMMKEYTTLGLLAREPDGGRDADFEIFRAANLFKYRKYELGRYSFRMLMATSRAHIA